MKRVFSTILTLGVVVILTSCGGGSGGSSGGGAGTRFVPGKWTFSLFSSTSNLFGPITELDMDLVESGSTISSSNLQSVDGSDCAGMHMDSSSGTTSGDKIKLVFNIDSEKLTLDGTLDPDGETIGISNGHWSSSGGGCLDGQHGLFTASFVPSLTGSSTGTLGFTNIPGIANVTAMLSEDSDFNISGSMAVAGSPCLSSLTIAPNNLGMSVGSFSAFEMSDGTNVLDIMGQVFTEFSSSPIFTAQANVIAGCTEELGGELALNLTADTPFPPPAVSGAKSAAHQINPLLVERMKVLMAARRSHAD